MERVTEERAGRAWRSPPPTPTHSDHPWGTVTYASRARFKSACHQHPFLERCYALKAIARPSAVLEVCGYAAACWRARCTTRSTLLHAHRTHRRHALGPLAVAPARPHLGVCCPAQRWRGLPHTVSHHSRAAHNTCSAPHTRDRQAMAAPTPSPCLHATRERDPSGVCPLLLCGLVCAAHLDTLLSPIIHTRWPPHRDNDLVGMANLPITLPAAPL